MTVPALLGMPRRGPVPRLAVALVGAVLVLSTQLGLAPSDEPSGRRGPPSDLVPPSRSGARVPDAPLGRAAVLFGGNGWNVAGYEATLVLVAAAGERYRVIDQTALLLPGLESMLSGDGRYVSYGSQILDLSTGRPGPQVPGVVKVWSAAGHRLAYPRKPLRAAGLELAGTATRRREHR